MSGRGADAGRLVCTGPDVSVPDGRPSMSDIQRIVDTWATLSGGIEGAAAELGVDGAAVRAAAWQQAQWFEARERTTDALLRAVAERNAFDGTAAALMARIASEQGLSSDDDGEVPYVVGAWLADRNALTGPGEATRHRLLSRHLYVRTGHGWAVLEA